MRVLVSTVHRSSPPPLVLACGLSIRVGEAPLLPDLRALGRTSDGREPPLPVPVPSPTVRDTSRACIRIDARGGSGSDPFQTM
jgi:hypothetical protein